MKYHSFLMNWRPPSAAPPLREPSRSRPLFEDAPPQRILSPTWGPLTHTTPDTIASFGLAIGGIFGLAGTFVASAPLRESLWAIDGVALVVATALLTMKYQRLGNDCFVAGFLTFLAGETLLLAGNAAGLQASVPSYVGGISLWAAALILISVPSTFALWMRLTALVAAALFLVSVSMVLWGTPLLPTSSPLPAAGYPFLVLTFAGWIWTLVRAEG
ncbi:hypothetical protein [Mesorhizobium loti]|uniref:hypothetical protein n=1 Tax=Rhizobium loti TaxID=381 RepID=UPI001FD8E132|nr:hypothetical protein [Mesorhizobium loti]